MQYQKHALHPHNFRLFQSHTAASQPSTELWDGSAWSMKTEGPGSSSWLFCTQLLWGGTQTFSFWQNAPADTATKIHAVASLLSGGVFFPSFYFQETNTCLKTFTLGRMSYLQTECSLPFRSALHWKWQAHTRPRPTLPPTSTERGGGGG